MTDAPEEQNMYLTPSQQRVQTQDICIGRLFVKVGVLDTVTSVGQGQSHSVCAKLFDTFSEGQGIPLALRHFLSVEHQVTIHADAQRPLVFWEDGDVVVEQERQVVLYQVLAGRSNVEWIKVVEFVLHHIRFLPRKGLGIWPRSVAEDVLPGFVGHLLSCHAQGADGVPSDVAACFIQCVR
jgi:hypothetical protein